MSERPSTACMLSMDEIWSGRKGRVVSEMDSKATLKLIELVSRKDLSEALNDNKLIKKTVWNKIADEIREAGFVLNHENGGERCHQKWRNLVQTYKDHKTLLKRKRNQHSAMP